MTSLVLPLTKAGESAPKLALNLQKAEVFTILLSWEGDTDVDLHALRCVNPGTGAKAESFGDVLSTYNVQRKIRDKDTGVMVEVGTLPKNADGTFEIHGGAMVHSKDAEDGKQDGVDEWIRVCPDKLPKSSAGLIEIPIVAMIHHDAKENITFKNVTNATVTIRNSSGATLMTASLSNQFGDFDGVQMGSIMFEEDGSAHFVQVGTGFKGDFNTVLAHFS